MSRLSERKKWVWTPDKRRYFLRRRGQLIRLTGQPGTPEFDASYWAAVSGRETIKTTWQALVESYRAGERWQALAPRTRHDYDKVITYVLQTNAARDVTRTTRGDVLAAMRANAHRPRFANYIQSVLSVLLEHAIDLGWIAANPAKGARQLATPPGRRQEHRPWPAEAVALWRAKAAPLPRLIMELGLGTAQRPGDLVRFRWGDYRAGALSVRQGKTGRALALPCPPVLRALLDAAAQPDPAAPILARQDGGPLTYRRLAEIMLAERQRLGTADHDLHGLRYSAVIELALAGCDDDEIMSYSGHATRAMVRKYAGLARQMMRAETAAAKREQAENKKRT